jgi:hypothetical protein
MSDTKINDLDFDSIKSSLRDYLRGQEQFKDYDFEGSTLNILLDLLAYNTHYQGFYANMVANEAFLDSAIVRNSVVSLAKHLNYRPRSKKAARAVVNIEMIPINSARGGVPASATVAANKEYLPPGKSFSARDALGKTVNFVNLENYRFSVVGGRFFINNAILYEGNIQTSSFVVNVKDVNQKFIIDDDDIDIDTLFVKVQRSVRDTTGIEDVWFRALDVNKLDGNSLAFFVQEAEGGKWEIYFGDGIVGKNVENGNLISIIYLRTNGTLGNGIGNTDTEQNRTFTTTNTDTSQYIVSVVRDENGRPSPSFGGSEPESINSIKYYAPRNYQAQDRAVTSTDYLVLLAKEYSLRSESFLVWGGEENDPPNYGKVFISVKPKNSSKLSITEKQAISKSILSPLNVLTVKPEVVDADVTYINPSVTVYYDPRLTTSSADSLSQGIRDKIITFGDINLDQFGKNFRQSKFSSYIDGLDASFNSSSISLLLEKRFEVKFGQALPYKIKYDNKLFHPIDGYPPIISSSGFFHLDLTATSLIKPTVVAYFDDDGYGNIRIYKLIGSERVYLKRKAGTVNYETGLIEIKSFTPLGIPDGTVEINILAKPDKGDIFVRRNQVLVINTDKIDITMVQEKSVIDRKASDTGFPFLT